MAVFKTHVSNMSDQHSTVGERFLRLIVDTIPALIVSTLPDGSVEFINKGLRDYTGLPRENLTGCGWNSVIPPDDLERFTKEWDDARTAGKSFENQARSDGMTVSTAGF